MKQTLFALTLLISLSASAQTDTVKKLNEVTVKGYYNPQPLLRAVGSVSMLDSNQIKNQPSTSLVSLVNTAPGVRMEERSPGSYRLSLRGSLLRSPFGIRNVKIYIDNFPLTDAGGNTYLNALDVAAVGNLEIYKGPEASIFGANTGGALLINSTLKKANDLNLTATAGSFGLFQQTASLNQVTKNYNFNITGAYQQSDGYRENSALKRRYIQTSHLWDYSIKGQLKAFLFYSDLDYQTPGGLTVAQFTANPKAARPATPTLPGAIQQKAAIYNKSFFAGLSHNYSFNQHFKHVIALFTSNTDFKNPFITNYEKRKESTVGLRTFIEFATISHNIKYNIQAGLESSSTKSDIKNYGNAQGVATSLTASDDLKAHQDFGFLRVNFDIKQKLLVELGSSLNFFSYDYESYFPIAVAEKQRSFKTRLMPKIAASYLIDSNLTFRASVSKGYSPPTLAEVRSSDNIINNNLQAEAGWNYESGLRYQTKNKRFFTDGTIFYFQLRDAIVRRLNTGDVEYFINAGGTKQLGLELQTAFWLIKANHSQFLNGLLISNSFTYSHFKFQDFKNAGADYGGNKLTGVPKHTIISGLEFNFQKGIYLFAQHNYTSAIPLNDANTVFARKYHLADLKAGIRNLNIGKTAIDISLGANNLFNQSYSLGNDLNAANNRYFNTAMKRNYYASLGITL
ncbi:TonB-dependent receptor [Pedobacter polaris]|uniref:TonB-dependent receptor n=1 Tax=Pedobacter polaris TaxID=2571273 RepID=A0A4U1CER3_9SPHI|nr:TonB-dependent receptor [Pedobacter polaris]TKC05552.1 TonB-dependent receptor [Pedobacter polaris]